MNIVCCGRREEGKTTLAMHIARKHHRGVVVFDPRGMINGTIVYGSSELEDAIEGGMWQNGPIVYRYDSGDANSEFDEMCSVLFPPQFTKGGFSLVVDEAGQLQTAHSINENFIRAIKQHPTSPLRESVTIIQTNHRLAEFHGASKSLMNELYIFQTTYDLDLRTLEQHTGLPQMSEIVKNLPQHHCVRYLYGRQPNNKQYEVWDNPLIWFNDIKRGPSSSIIPPSKSNNEGWYI